MCALPDLKLVCASFNYFCCVFMQFVSIISFSFTERKGMAIRLSGFREPLSFCPVYGCTFTSVCLAELSVVATFTYVLYQAVFPHRPLYPLTASTVYGLGHLVRSNCLHFIANFTFSDLQTMESSLALIFGPCAFLLLVTFQTFLFSRVLTKLIMCV